MKWLSLALFFLTCSSLPLAAQQFEIDSSLLQPKGLQVLQTTRGDIFFGKLAELGPDSLTFELRDLGPIRFGREEIRRLDLVKDAGWLANDPGMNSDEYALFQVPEDFWEHNLLYSVTAFPYPKGGGEYRNVSILYNVVDVGVSDNFSLGGGMIIPFLFVLRTKLAFNLSDKVHLGLGANNFIGLDRDLGGIISHLFAAATIGNSQQFFNITAGPAFDWEFPEDRPFIMTVGGGFTIGSNWKIYADVGVSPGNQGIVPSFMISWFKKKNRLEAGLIAVADGFFSAIPMIGYAHRF